VSLDQQYYRDAHLFVDLRHELVTLDVETVRLTRMQYQVLALLVKHAGEVVPRANFLMQIWRHVPELSPRQVDIHINALRRKLGAYADHYIETVIGTGYRFRPLQ
jgi:two-component system, OmpR family, KDP operon response regulator KdpE